MGGEWGCFCLEWLLMGVFIYNIYSTEFFFFFFETIWFCFQEFLLNYAEEILLEFFFVFWPCLKVFLGLFPVS